MFKFLKYLLLTCLGLIVLSSIGIWILVSTISPNALKGPISQQVQNLTGHKLIINGDIRWSFFPWLGINIQNIKLANNKDFGDTHLIRLKEADIQLKLLPLIKSKIEVGNIVLKGLSVNLTRNAEGKTNWNNFLDVNAAKNDNIIKENHQATRYSLAPIALTISSVNIDDANINFDDQKNNHKYTIQNLHLQSKNIGLNHDFPIALTFDFNSANQKNPKENVDGKIMLNTTVELDQEQQFIRLSSAALTAKLQGAELPKEGTQINLQTSLSLHLKSAKLHIPSIRGKIANMQFQGDISGENIFTDPSFSGDLSIAQFNPKRFVEGFGISFPKFHDTKAFEQVELKTHFVFTPTNIAFSKLNFSFDDSDLTGDAKIAFLDKSDFNLSLNHIVLNDYLITSSAKANSNTATTTSTNISANSSNAEVIPVAILRKLNLSGTLAINNISIGKLSADQFKIGINADKGLIKITPMTTYLYKGTYSAAMTLDVRGDEPKLAFVENINNVQVEPLMNALNPNKNSPITGTLALSSNVYTRGATIPRLTQNLNGKVNFALNNGILKGIDLDHQIEVAGSLLNKTSNESSKSSDQTTFKNLTGSINIKNGIASNNDLFLQSTRLQATGSGIIDLINQNINYNLKLNLLANTTDPKLINIQNALGGSIPIKITGTFANFKVYPDAAAIAKAAATAYVHKAAGKISSQVQAQLDKEVGKFGGQLQQHLKSLLQ